MRPWYHPNSHKGDKAPYASFRAVTGAPAADYAPGTPGFTREAPGRTLRFALLQRAFSRRRASLSQFDEASPLQNLYEEIFYHKNADCQAGKRRSADLFVSEYLFLNAVVFRVPYRVLRDGPYPPVFGVIKPFVHIRSFPPNGPFFLNYTLSALDAQYGRLFFAPRLLSAATEYAII